MKRTIKDMGLFEKLLFTTTAWVMCCRMQPAILCVLIFPLGLLSVPFGAMFFPHYMLWPLDVEIPERFVIIEK